MPACTCRSSPGPARSGIRDIGAGHDSGPGCPGQACSACSGLGSTTPPGMGRLALIVSVSMGAVWRRVGRFLPHSGLVPGVPNGCEVPGSRFRRRDGLPKRACAATALLQREWLTNDSRRHSEGAIGVSYTHHAMCRIGPGINWSAGAATRHQPTSGRQMAAVSVWEVTIALGRGLKRCRHGPRRRRTKLRQVYDKL